jgi:AcrR family transcriptional regulator
MADGGSAQDTQERLIEAALDMFGAAGFAGTSTRALAARAGVNLSAILYHFKGKQGLYDAAIERAATLFLGPLEEGIDRADALIEARVAPDAARECLVDLVGHAAEIALGDAPGRAQAARFIVYQMLNPGTETDPFRRRIMEPLMGRVSALLAIARGVPIADPAPQMQATGLMGQMLMFRLLQGSPYDRGFVPGAVVAMIKAQARDIARA